MAEAKDAKTTARDATDSGVSMLAGDPSEPVGPEDALGRGPKRGDYSQVVGNRQHYHAVANPDWDPTDTASPRSLLEHQNPNVADRGDVKGKKGGVQTG